MLMKNCNDTNGNRTRDLPACNSVPQPTSPPRTPANINRNNKKNKQVVAETAIAVAGNTSESKYHGKIYESKLWCAITSTPHVRRHTATTELQRYFTTGTWFYLRTLITLPSAFRVIASSVAMIAILACREPGSTRFSSMCSKYQVFTHVLKMFSFSLQPRVAASKFLQIHKLMDSTRSE